MDALHPQGFDVFGEPSNGIRWFNARVLLIAFNERRKESAAKLICTIR
jgi:hypothetical protein